jgi:hypothetical protein
MMDFGNLTIHTKLCVYTPITREDSSTIIDIRANNNKSVLNKISRSISQQNSYYDEYEKKFNDSIEIYFKVLEPLGKKPLGLVRLTELNEDHRFNFQSLIFKETSPPFMSIDAIFTMYEIGFIKFDKDICGPWMVPREGKKIYNLHKKMDIATEVMANEKFYYFVVTKDRFLERREYFKNFGFGLKSIGV